LDDLRELTKNYIIPEWACKAQTTLLNLLLKMDKNNT
jgi:iron-sulfur cluster repair protein YtfE (RIC family)